MDLVALVERFGSEDRCHKYLEDLRWPEGVRCPRCDSDKISRIIKRRQFDCDGCRYQFSVRVGTVLHDSHLPLWKWFLAVYMMCESRKGISANQLKRTIRVSYETAWYLTHRIRSAMVPNPDAPELSGSVEVDETYVGGKARKGSKAAKGTSQVGHNPKASKVMVLGALERGGDVRLRVEKRAGGAVIRSFVYETVDEDSSVVYTDGHAAYRSLSERGVKHESVDHSSEEWVRGEVGTQGIESAWSLFKRSIVGSYHQLSGKHLQAYVDEFAFRFNNRENPYLFRDTILRLVAADPLTYRELVGSDVRPR